MRNPEIDKINGEFVVSALQQMEPKNAQFTIAIAVNEKNEILIMNTPKLNSKEVYLLLTEAARAIQQMGGGIILLN